MQATGGADRPVGEVVPKPPAVEGWRLAARNALSKFPTRLSSEDVEDGLCVGSAGRDARLCGRPEARRYRPKNVIVRAGDLVNIARS